MQRCLTEAEPGWVDKERKTNLGVFGDPVAKDIQNTISCRASYDELFVTRPLRVVENLKWQREKQPNVIILVSNDTVSTNIYIYKTFDLNI